MKRHGFAFLLIPMLALAPGCKSRSVKITIDGAGSVVSNPEGIDCQTNDTSRCEAELGRAITLTAIPDPTVEMNAFNGWQGDDLCSAADVQERPTIVIQDEDEEGFSCTATFASANLGAPAQ
jgi:hypothetical protein